MASDDSWIPGVLSPGEERLTEKYAEGKWCVSPRLEWSGNVPQEVMLLCVLKEVQGLAEQKTLAVYFLSQKGEENLLARLQN